ncbi:MAG: FAD-binding oxidoreductase [Thermomicrobiales bacterium]|nr:FAD-binding oxidoreductase [Thermomicrobiales bacterium]
MSGANVSGSRSVTGLVSRRRVLQGAAASTLAAGLPWWRQAAAAQATPVAQTSDAAWSDLANRLDGWLLREGDPMYAAATEINAARFSAARPAGIAVCVTPRDAATCVAWARETGTPFAVRSGGHSYAGFSTSPGLVINVRRLGGVTVDPANGTVTVGGGVNNADFAAGVTPYGVTVPGGRCPTVGLSGLTLGGGWGFSNRHLGMTCDALVATDIALGSGEIVTASESENQDLFWALRGGAGGNFGVNTSLTYRFTPTRPVTFFEASWTGGDTAAVIAALMHLQLVAPDELGLRLAVHSTSRTPRSVPAPLAVDVIGLHWGEPEVVRELAEQVEAVQLADQWTIEKVAFPDARSRLAATTPTGTYQIKTGFVRGALPAEGLVTLLEGLAAMPGVPSRVQESTVGIYCMGGKVNQVAPEATAFVHRDADFIFKSEVLWEPSDDPDLIVENLDWIEAFHASMQPYLSGGAYQNFVDRSQENWAEAYYGANLPRLVDMKRRWDPENLFRFQQSIPLSL